MRSHRLGYLRDKRPVHCGGVDGPENVPSPWRAGGNGLEDQRIQTDAFEPLPGTPLTMRAKRPLEPREKRDRLSARRRLGPWDTETIAREIDVAPLQRERFAN